MYLYSQDYKKKPPEKDWERYREVQKMEQEGLPLGKRNLYTEYPESIRHYLSLFPNNHIELFDIRDQIALLNQEYIELINNPETNERAVLDFINHRPAYHIVASLLSRTAFGHHEAYIIPEFRIGGGKYRADYLLIGKNSGGYEFVFVELESPNKKSTIRNGHDGLHIRYGMFQIEDWKSAIEADFSLIEEEFQKYTNKELPIEFHKCDTTRYHYVVVSGRRDDYNETSYRERRRRDKETDIVVYHYDNLYDLSVDLESATSF